MRRKPRERVATMLHRRKVASRRIKKTPETAASGSSLFPIPSDRERWDDFLTRELIQANDRVAEGRVTPTLNAADLLGWSDRIGSLEAGKWADIIAVEGNPIADVKLLQDVKWVMKSGVVYKGTGAK